MLFKSIRRKFIIWRIKKALRFLGAIDRTILKKANRTQRRQFWRTVIKDRNFRENLLNIK